MHLRFLLGRFLVKSLFDTAKSTETNHVFGQIKGFLGQQDSAEFIAREATSITLATVREGISPSILIINGYLSKEGEEVSDWLSVIDELYPENKVIHVRWNAGDVTDITVDDSGEITDEAQRADKLLAAAKRASDMCPAGVAALVGEIVADKLLGHWKKSLNEARHAGNDLAKAIKEDETLHGAILMGYSLGASVTHQALNSLEPNSVIACYLLAGAVSAEVEHWEPILDKHTELRLINCYSNNDYVLKSAYGAGTILDHKPVGLTKIRTENFNHMLNLDVSAFASGHMNFKNAKVGEALACLKA